MGCGNPTAEERMLLTKLERLEVQVQKEKELKKLSELEGKKYPNSGLIHGGQPKKTGLNKINKNVKTKKVKLSPVKKKQEKDDSIKIFKAKGKSKPKVLKKKGSTKTEAKSKNNIRKKNLSKPKLKKKAASEDSMKNKKKKK